MIPDDDLIGFHLDEAAKHLIKAQGIVDYSNRVRLDGFMGAALLGVKAAQEELKGEVD